MSEVPPGPALKGGRRAHNACTLSFRVAHMSPSSSGADVRLSLLEGDCVGPTRPILKAGLSRARLFFDLPGYALTHTGFARRSLSSERLSASACDFHHEEDAS